MSQDAADPVFARYLIAPVIIDGPVLPLGEAEFRIIGTIAAPEGDACSCGMNPPADWRKICATCGGEDELLRFRVTDWAGPYLPRPAEVPMPAIPQVDAFVEAWRKLSTECEDLRTLVIHAIGAAEPTCAGDPMTYLRGDWLQRAYAQTGIERPALCCRVLVGRGSDTFDPCCVLPAGHEEPCKP